MLRIKLGFNPLEKRVVVVISIVYMVRMLGLFMVLPVLALVGDHFTDTTPVLIGLALGIYGLPQAFLQIPLGLASDRIGRKPIIIAGLLIFVVGSLIAAFAGTMIDLIIGRAVQGAGAIAATMMALAADLTREEKRSSVFAFIGVGIGLAFMLALILGPLVESVFGLRGIFLASAMLGVFAIVLIWAALPSPVDLPVQIYKRDEQLSKSNSSLGEVLYNHDLLRLSAGVFFLHLIMTANFLLLPLLLERQLNLEHSAHWMFYIPVLLGSFIFIFPLLRWAEKARQVKGFVLAAVILLGVSQYLAFVLEVNWLSIVVVMVLFFVAFNYLEASLPALVSRFCNADAKGVAMGVFSNGQFLGAFAGGVLAGWVSSVWGGETIYLMNMAITIVWLLVVIGMGSPRYLTDE